MHLRAPLQIMNNQVRSAVCATHTVRMYCMQTPRLYDTQSVQHTGAHARTHASDPTGMAQVTETCLCVNRHTLAEDHTLLSK